jgi:hypothetical protein
VRNRERNKLIHQGENQKETIEKYVDTKDRSKQENREKPRRPREKPAIKNYVN